MKATTLDNILYLVIALAIVGAIVLVAWYQEAHGLPIRMPVSERQFGLFTITSVVFGYAIKTWRKAWHSVRFWVALSLLFVACVPVQVLIIWSLPPRVGLYGLLAWLELFVLLFILEKLLPRIHHGHPSEKTASRP